MRRAHLLVVATTILVALGAASAVSASATATLSTSQVIARFKGATGATLLVDRTASSPGHYTALRLSPSVSNLARYGRFTLYVVGPAATADDVTKLLADGHTGELGTPGASRIYWESGRYLSGGNYWLAKKQYGSNLVLWWYGAKQKIDPAFARIHRPLVTRVVGA